MVEKASKAKGIPLNPLGVIARSAKRDEAIPCLREDCFAEFTHGLAAGETRGLAMTLG
jgi:hypothetical protein